MMCRNFIAGFFIVSLLIACNNREGDAPAPGDAEDDSVNELLLRSDSSLDADVAGMPSLKAWLSFIQPAYPLNTDSFRLSEIWMEDSLITEPFKPDTSFFPLYGKYLKYSADSAYFVDLDSYNIMLSDKNGLVSGTEAGPDQQIFLVDKTNGIRKRLLFNGPGTYIQDAFWVDNESVLLLSIAETDVPNKFRPVLWKINIVEDLYERYDYGGAMLSEFPRYVENVRFKGVKVR